MTRVVIYKSKDCILGFEVSGHSGYAEEGFDIVCSAISTATQMAVVGIKEVLKLNVFYEMSDGYLKLKLKNDQSGEAQAILKAMYKTLQDISKEYGKYVKLEVKKDVY